MAFVENLLSAQERQVAMRYLLVVGMLVTIVGCSTVSDRDGAEKNFYWSWDKGVEAPGEPGDIHPEYDERGNLIADADVVNTYRFPDIHTGAVYDLRTGEMTPVAEIEVAEFKIPKLGWFSTGVIGGDGLVGGHLSKNLVGVLELETGVFVGFDADENRLTYGVDVFVIKW